MDLYVWTPMARTTGVKHIWALGHVPVGTSYPDPYSREGVHVVGVSGEEGASASARERAQEGLGILQCFPQG